MTTDQAPRGVGIYFRSRDRLGHRIRPPSSSLSRSIYFVDNKFRRANSGFLLIAEKGRVTGPPFFGIALRVFVPHMLWKSWGQVTSGQATDHVKWPNLKNVRGALVLWPMVTWMSKFSQKVRNRCLWSYAQNGGPASVLPLWTKKKLS